VTTRGYTVLGWVVWQIARRLAKYELRQNRVKVGAAAVVGAVLVAGVLAAKSGSSEES
jgi:hypothetical protein